MALDSSNALESANTTLKQLSSGTEPKSESNGGEPRNCKVHDSRNAQKSSNNGLESANTTLKQLSSGAEPKSESNGGGAQLQSPRQLQRAKV
jgi:hypothetical protein